MSGRNRVVKLAKDAPHFGQKDLADFRYPHMMRAALYKRHPKFAFEPLNLLTECRLHNVFPCRCTTEMTFLRERHEISKLTQLHPANGRRIRRSGHE